MISKRLLVFGAIVFTLIATLLLWTNHTNKKNTGYCFVKNRYLGESELKDAALQSLYTRLINEYNHMSPDLRSTVIFYKSFQNFKDSNPDCCRDKLNSDFWNRSDMQPYWKDKGTDFFFTTKLRIYLDKLAENTSKNTQAKSTVSVQIHACGEVRSLRIGNTKFKSRNGVSNVR